MVEILSYKLMECMHYFIKFIVYMYLISHLFILISRKRWLLFPPESGNLQPTRVPYEESSIYSQLNFFTPKDLSYFKSELFYLL